jgi:hypothetical protein
MRAKQKTFSAAVCAVLGAAAMTLLAIPSAHPHHSFAIYDFATEVAFEGVVESVNFRNPHIAMTLAWEDENGDTQIIDFVEGAPANMLVRSGFDPNWLAPGSKITAIGSPRHDNPDAYFLKSVILEDGSEHRSIGN